MGQSVRSKMCDVFCRHVRRSIEQLRRGASKQVGFQHVNTTSSSSYNDLICFLSVSADVLPLNCLHSPSVGFVPIIFQQFIAAYGQNTTVIVLYRD